MGVMLTNKNWETPYYAHIGDKDKLGNMWSANLHYLNYTYSHRVYDACIKKDFAIHECRTILGSRIVW